MSNSLKNLILFSVFIAFIISCKSIKSTNDEAFLDNHLLWKQRRIEKLTTPFGYMSMAGLFWLKSDTVYIGSNKSNEIRFPDSFPDTIGKIIFDGQKYMTSIDPSFKANINGTNLGQSEMILDSKGKPTKVNWKSYYWYLIQRGDKIGIRLMDTLSTARLNLKTIPSFSANQDWIIPAQFIPANADDKLAITNVLDITTDYHLEGHLHFKYNGESYTLAATKGGENELFIVFSDLTNGVKTYGGGRFLSVTKPLNGSLTTIDFNRSVNPICAFNDYATCPLPPLENKLPFEVNAGELKVREK